MFPPETDLAKICLQNRINQTVRMQEILKDEFPTISNILHAVGSDG